MLASVSHQGDSWRSGSRPWAAGRPHVASCPRAARHCWSPRVFRLRRSTLDVPTPPRPVTLDHHSARKDPDSTYAHEQRPPGQSTAVRQHPFSVPLPWCAHRISGPSVEAETVPATSFGIGPTIFKAPCRFTHRHIVSSPQKAPGDGSVP